MTGREGVKGGQRVQRPEGIQMHPKAHCDRGYWRNAIFNWDAGRTKGYGTLSLLFPDISRF